MNRQLMKLSGLVALLASAATSVMADYPSTVSSLNPIAYWRLGETTQPPTADSAFNLGTLGNSAIGYYLGTALHPTPGALAAGSATAATFDGTANSVMRVPHQPAINPAQFTAEVWLNPAIENAAGTLTCPISIGAFGAPRSGWLIYQANNGWNLRMYNQNALATSLNITGGSAPAVGTWYHVVASFDGTVAKLYVNGVMVAQGTAQGTAAVPANYVPGASGGLAIGGRADSSFWWSGSADEMALYSTALSDAEIASHYSNGISTSPSTPYQTLILAANPVAYYPLNEGTYTPPTILPVAANSSSAGATYDGSYNPGMLAAAPGPQPPAQSGFPAGNTGGGFNGAAGHVSTPFQLNDATEFSLSGWIRRGAFKSGRGGYFGQNNVLEFGDTGGGASVELYVERRGSLTAPFPFADNEWGQFVITANLTSTILYANGVEIGRLSGTIESYATSDFLFNIGGGGIFNNTGDYFQGNIDEVAVFPTALTPAQIQTLYYSANIAPKITRQPSIPSRTLYSGYTLALSAAANGTPPLSYQWRKGGVPIGGQTSANLIINGVVASDAGEYDVVVTNPYGSTPSAKVAVTVTPADSVAPTILYAAGLAGLNKARIWFSEPLDPVTAQNPANYTIPGLAVTAATLVAPPGNVGDSMVELTTSAQPPGTTYTVTVSNVKDQMLPATTIAAASTATFSSWALAEGLVRFEHYDNIPSAADSGIDAGLADPRVIAGTPTTLGALVGRFDTRTFFPNDSNENYMARMTGFITPKTTGDYYFFVASDDASRVYLSSNEVPPNPATDTPIVYELGCCGSFFEPDSGDTATTATPIRLVANQKYAFVVLLKEGGGGDWLRLAWREANDTTPAASLAPIDGQFLSTYVDPNVDVAFTKQPTDQTGILPSTAINFVNQSFASVDGGYTVTNSETEPPGPWLYDAASGTWTAEGSVDGCGGPYHSRLSSTEYTVPVAQAVTLSFSHRYSFEADRWDGGQVLISVNGGGFTNVAATNFTANGYAPGLIQGNGVINGQRAFMENSPGYASGTFITTSAILGTFKANDKIVVQFLGAWDDCSKGLSPSWQIKDVKLSYSSAPMSVAFEAGATVTRQGSPVAFTYKWQRNDGAGFTDITGATGPTYSFFPTVAADMTASFRVLAGVPGKYIPSSVVKVVAPRPSLAFTPTATGVSVSFTGTLQSAPSISGPFVNVGGASSPYVINAPSAASQFFRSVQ